MIIHKWFKTLSVSYLNFCITNTKVTNLTSVVLSDLQTTALSKGFSFIPSSSPFDLLKPKIDTAINRLTDAARWAQHYANHTDNRTPLEKKLYRAAGTHNPRPQHPRFELFLKHVHNSLIEAIPNALTFRNNFYSDEKKALRTLSSRKDIRIIPSDKNNGPVIVYAHEYLREMHKHLSSDAYEKIDSKSLSCLLLRTEHKIRSLTHHLSKNLQSSIYRFFQPVRYPRLYLLAKIHKPPPPDGTFTGRLIAPAHSWITTGAAKYVDAVLQPHLHKLNTVLSDSTSLVAQFDGKKIPKDHVLMTYDIDSLYPSIPIEECLSWFKEILQEVLFFSPEEVSLLYELTSVVLKNHVVLFDKLHYLQILGTAMGCPLAVVFAQIVVYSLERRVLKHLRPFIYKRYIDDGLVCIHKNLVDTFKSRLNKEHKNFRFTFSAPSLCVDYLNLTIKIIDGTIMFFPYKKLINPSLFLPFSSGHSTHLKQGFIKGKIITIIRNSSLFETYLSERDNLVTLLRARGYPLSLITQVANTVSYSERKIFLQRKLKEDKPLPLFFHLEFNALTRRLPLNSCLTNFWDKDFIYLHSRFFRKPMVSYTKAPNLLRIIKNWTPRDFIF